MRKIIVEYEIKKITFGSDTKPEFYNTEEAIRTVYFAVPKDRSSLFIELIKNEKYVYGASITDYQLHLNTPKSFETDDKGSNDGSNNKAPPNLNPEDDYHQREPMDGRGTIPRRDDPHFSFTRTSSSMSILIESIDYAMAAGDEVAVFTPDALCAGAKDWSEEDGGRIGFGAWADNPLTEEVVEGFVADEVPEYRIWDNSISTEIVMEVNGIMHGRNIFRIRAIVRIEELSESEWPNDTYFSRQWTIHGSHSQHDEHDAFVADEYPRIDNAWLHFDRTKIGKYKGTEDRVEVAVIEVHGLYTRDNGDIHLDISTDRVTSDGFTQDMYDDFMNEEYGEWSEEKMMKSLHHGIVMTGILSATINNDLFMAGIVPEANIWVTEIYYEEDDAEAIEDYVGDDDRDFKVVNMSFTLGQKSEAETNTLRTGFEAMLSRQSLHEQRLFFCCASTMNGEEYTVEIPSTCLTVFTIQSVDKDLNRCSGGSYGHTDQVPPYKNGEDDIINWIDYSMPGFDVSSVGILFNTNGNHIDVFSDEFEGTSVASAAAAGVGVLVKAIKPDMSVEQFDSCAQRSAFRIGGDNYNAEYGYGMMNAGEMVSSLLEVQEEDIKAPHADIDYKLDLYPNPANSEFTVRFNIPQRGDYSLKVYDMLGRILIDKLLGQLSISQHSFSFSTTDFASGSYLVALSEKGVFKKGEMLKVLK
ncbi:MAG: S8/S53 family peptidase [Candidatus Hatepunaea meridiana]|nr:S8/S53 family peptidase [Candidatus Hatepunaea meridiana]